MFLNNKYELAKSMKIISFLALYCYSSIALSLGLGDIKVQSALGQPFYAEIPIFQDKDNLIPPEQIYISFRSPSNSQQELTNNNYANKNLLLRFKSSENSSDAISITSKNRIKEPIVQFTVELVWNTGKLYKQFNVLLDPPGLYPARPKASNTVNNRTYGTDIEVIPAPFNYKPSGFNHGKYGPINFGETLSGITQNLSSQLDEEYGALLSAIFFGNPDAFINNNINKLKQGSILTIPKTDSAATVSPNSSEKFLSLTQQNITPTITREKIDKKPFGLKYSVTLSLERLEEGKSTLLEQKDLTNEAEIIPKEMIVDGEESVPVLKAKIAQLESDNTLLEKRLLLLERKVFSQSDNTQDNTNERLQTIEKEIFSPDNEINNNEEIIVVENIAPEEDNKKAFNYWLWIPIITAILFLVFLAYYFYRSSVADNQLRAMLKNRSANLRQTPNKSNIPLDRVYDKTIPAEKSHDAYKPNPENIKAYETDKLENETENSSPVKPKSMIQELISEDESLSDSPINSEDDTLEDINIDSEEENHVIDFSTPIDFDPTIAVEESAEEQEPFTENHIIEPDNLIEPPSASSNELSIDAPEINFQDEAEFEKPSIEENNSLSLEEPIKTPPEPTINVEESKRSKALHEAELHIAFEQFEKAEPLLSELVANVPEGLDYKIKYAQTLLKLDKTAEAKDLVDDLLTKKSKLGEEQIDIIERMSLELFDTPS